ncbi:agmatinase family protein [Staphylococcus gallinarum]|uniref:agmatinase family protein n=1 Tax=Staphylococcus gallinarum TaxID=1293 RepID=UPI000D1FBE56|nr:agmatinase family protein [Staphylococcus gallinarum]MCD8821797.1 agmatinase family protein [Staphylococcus gallinarum]MCD8871844.1 agmatinase family protein [Staphylococcus gallinarum]MCW0984136.1 agmatinase family protein [Staphylococcus gallinarum]MEB6243520.1 agmatinase family protein [Staphylococcus gallinarum]MEB6296560.1 agmatinase family protein [Staphylococcus gallinarum]
MKNNIYGNIPCFLNSKNLTKSQTLDTDVIIYGAPFEGESTWGDYTGVELGPKQIRSSSARYSQYLPELNHINISNHLSLGDVGDVPFVAHDNKQSYENIEDFVKPLWESGKFLVGFGGEHGVTYPILKSLTETTGKKVGIIHLDAHYDNMPDYEGEIYARNTPFMHLYHTDGIRNESIIHTGIHGPRNKPETGKYANEAGAVTITINDIRAATNLKQFARDIYKQASKDVDVVYLTICSDVLDFAFNPGGPVDGNGMTSYELLTMIYEFGTLGLCGMDYVEVYPMNDPNQNSAHFVSTAVLYVLAGHVAYLNTTK